MISSPTKYPNTALECVHSDASCGFHIREIEIMNTFESNADTIDDLIHPHLSHLSSLSAVSLHDISG